MSKIDHRELNKILKGCKRLQRQSQRDLYDLLFHSVLMSITRFRLLQEEVEDLMQETFIRIFQQIEEYDTSKAEITTWASMIGGRLAINYCQSFQKRNLKMSMDELENHTTEPLSNSNLDLDLIQLSLDRIPTNYSEVFRLSIFEGLKHAAIAEQLNISESSSRVYLARAIELLKKDIKRLVS